MICETQIRNSGIKTWDTFREATASKDRELLSELDRFPNSILVTGCQRSGTTMLARIITESDGIVNFWMGLDNELDAALILSGLVSHQPQGRYCFQTTYLNERFPEYYQHLSNHKMLWVIRNPVSVVYSMLHNWGRHTPDRLFMSCGVQLLAGRDKWLYKMFGLQGIPMLRRACWAYNGKTAQLFELRRRFGRDRIMVVDYDRLVKDKEVILPAIYEFIELPYKSDYAVKINAQSLKKAERLSAEEIQLIESYCMPFYRKALDQI
jgi:hypothetical protein